MARAPQVGRPDAKPGLVSVVGYPRRPPFADYPRAVTKIFRAALATELRGWLRGSHNPWPIRNTHAGQKPSKKQWDVKNRTNFTSIDNKARAPRFSGGPRNFGYVYRVELGRAGFNGGKSGPNKHYRRIEIALTHDLLRIVSDAGPRAARLLEQRIAAGRIDEDIESFRKAIKEIASEAVERAEFG